MKIDATIKVTCENQQDKDVWHPVLDARTLEEGWSETVSLKQLGQRCEHTISMSWTGTP